MILDEPFDSAEYLQGITVAPMPDDGRDRPVAMFLAGGPLSGATGVAQQLADADDGFLPPDAVVVDPAMIREDLPEWQELYAAHDPQSAEAVRFEAMDIARQLTEAAGGQGLNLIIVGVGASEPGEFLGVMEVFAQAGYEVRVLLAHAPIEVELERNEARAAQTGLRFDPEVLKRLNTAVVQRHIEWRDAPWIAQFRVYDTGAPD